MPGAVPGMAPAQQTGPSQFKLFFDWVLAALKKPSLRMATPTWWACVPMFVEAAIVSLLVTIWAAKAASAVLYPAESILSMMGESSRSISVSSSDYFSLFFRGFIGVALVLYALVLIVFLGRKIFGDADTFRQVHDTFAQIVIPFAVFHLALVLLSLVGASVVAGVLFFLSLAFMALLPSYLVAISANHRKLDSFWLWLFAMIAVFFILVLLMIIFSNIAGSAFMGALSRWN